MIDHVRRRGSILIANEEISGDFLDWHRRVRHAARRAGIRIGVRRDDDTVLVYHPRLPGDRRRERAVMDAIGSGLSAYDDSAPVTCQDALRRRRRENLRVVRDEDNPGPLNTLEAG